LSSDFVAESIVKTAEELHSELIVMASHGRHGIKRLLLGSETSNVLAHCSIPVLVVR
jgi:nucleotide-binding universal stress UspA family protein